jgi:hypothetical protein
VARFGHVKHFEACEEGYEGRKCDECACEHSDECFFKQQSECEQCQPSQSWQLAVAISALGVGMLAFIFLKQGSGLLLLLECIIALSLMLLGVGASYLVDFVIFFVLLQLVEAASNYNSVGVHHSESERIVSLTGMAKHLIFYFQATVILTRNEFFPKSLSRVASAANVLNFRSSGLECLDWFRQLSKLYSPMIVKFGVSMAMPLLLVLFMAMCLTFRKVRFGKVENTTILLNSLKLYNMIRLLISRACCKGKGHSSVITEQDSDSKELLLAPNHENELLLHDNTGHLSPTHIHSSPSFFAELLAMILFVLFATYFELTDVVLENLSCVADPFTGLLYLESEPAVKCFGADYESLQTFAWIMVCCLFEIGVDFV